MSWKPKGKSLKALRNMYIVVPNIKDNAGASLISEYSLHKTLRRINSIYERWYFLEKQKCEKCTSGKLEKVSRWDSEQQKSTTALWQFACISLSSALESFLFAHEQKGAKWKQ